MKWEGNRESDNVEDARGSSGGGGGGFRVGGGSVGIGTVAVALVAGWVFGINPLTVLGLLGGGGSPMSQSAPGPVTAPPANDPQAKFVSQVDDPAAEATVSVTEVALKLTHTVRRWAIAAFCP